VPWSASTVTYRERRGARLARREESAYREYATDEQRRQAGCIGVRMPPYLRIRALAVTDHWTRPFGWSWPGEAIPQFRGSPAPGCLTAPRRLGMIDGEREGSGRLCPSPIPSTTGRSHIRGSARTHRRSRRRCPRQAFRCRLRAQRRHKDFGEPPMTSTLCTSSPSTRSKAPAMQKGP